MTAPSCLPSSETGWSLLLSLWLLGGAAVGGLGLCWQALQARTALALRAQRLEVYAASRALIEALASGNASLVSPALIATTYQARWLFNAQTDAFLTTLRDQIAAESLEQGQVSAALPVVRAFEAQGRALKFKQPSLSQSKSALSPESLQRELDRLTSPFFAASLCDRRMVFMAFLTKPRFMIDRLRGLANAWRRRAAQEQWRKKQQKREKLDAEYFGEL